MTEREQSINLDLRALDEAHRLGRISRAEYRARRRRILEPLFDVGGVVTARKVLVTPDALTAPRAQPRQSSVDETPAGSGRALTMLLSMRPAIAWKPLLGLAIGIVALALLAWWLLRSQ